MGNVSCIHVNEYKKECGLCSYEILHAFYVSCIARDSLERKARDCLCMTDSCKIKYQRIHACLSCIYFGCFSGGHIHEHAITKGHKLAIDTNYGYVFCFVCGDYQYDADFEKVARKQQLLSAVRKGVKYEPSEDDLELLHKKQVNVAEIGLRGIVNMGNTCYISVILQSLVHAPLFRDYFLSLKHKCSFQQTSPESQNIISESEPPVCFACEISNIVQEFFSGKEEPFVPNRLLHLLWTRADQLKGYKQQDAHEFLFILLNNLHLNCQGTNTNSVSSHLCKCIIDTIFTGFSKYVYTCQICCNEYTENIPFKDLALTNQTSTDNGPNYVSSLADCLKKSMMSVVPEVLCTECNEKRPFSVQMTLKKLPLIISFHQLCAQKKFISFPEYLDMTPYIISPRAQSNMDEKPANGLNASSNNTFYYLFAVVEHRGNEQSGHYVCYVRRLKTLWFLCNDKIVKQVSIEEVLKKKAYLLFYHKHFLEYEIKKEDKN